MYGCKTCVEACFVDVMRMGRSRREADCYLRVGLHGVLLAKSIVRLNASTSYLKCLDNSWIRTEHSISQTGRVKHGTESEGLSTQQHGYCIIGGGLGGLWRQLSE